jgi:hypothetical protein
MFLTTHKGRDNLVDIRVNGRVILTLILEKYGVKNALDSVGSE